MSETKTETADIVAAHLSHNQVATAELPGLIRSVFDALSKTAEPLVTQEARPEPAVSVRASVRPDYIVCLEDGAKLKMLKRYLRTRYDMSPEDYRKKWTCPPTIRWWPPTTPRSAGRSPIRSGSAARPPPRPQPPAMPTTARPDVAPGQPPMAPAPHTRNHIGRGRPSTSRVRHSWRARGALAS
jgi:predicted transcriptional regulator